MKVLPLAAAALGLAGGVLSLNQSPDQVILLTGDTRGYLSPCGCTEPMTGGVRRRATVLRQLARPGATTILDNGAFVDGVGRQDQIKAETLAEIMAGVGVTAINVAPEDGRLGPGYLSQVGRLAGGRLVTLSVPDPLPIGATQFQTSGPLLIGGATAAPGALAASLATTPVPLEVAARSLAAQAADLNLVPVLMLQGSREDAVNVARKFPSIRLIQYSSVGTPPAEIERVGGTALVTSGDHGKYVVKVEYRKGSFEGYRRIPLSPAVPNDTAASRLYSTYLHRVAEEDLLGKLPRKTTASYAGSWSCMPCHHDATRVWKNSEHRNALETLAREGHDKDPDCVSCHVVGLGSTKGFRTKTATPHLAGVGCESCHGPALAHVKDPSRAAMPKIDSKACVSCHNLENSPNFDFSAYWRKISH